MRGIKAGTEIKEEDIIRLILIQIETFDNSVSRYCFEVGTLLSVFAFMVCQLGEELKNAGVKSFWKNLVTV